MLNWTFIEQEIHLPTRTNKWQTRKKLRSQFYVRNSAVFLHIQRALKTQLKKKKPTHNQMEKSTKGMNSQFTEKQTQIT